MSDELKKSLDQQPPGAPKTPSVDVAEFLALKAIVMALTTTIAQEIARTGGRPAQSWLNEMAETCDNALAILEITGVSEHKADAIREKARDHVTNILREVFRTKDTQR